MIPQVRQAVHRIRKREMTMDEALQLRLRLGEAVSDRDADDQPYDRPRGSSRALLTAAVEGGERWSVSERVPGAPTVSPADVGDYFLYLSSTRS